jgi:hypothetical protein
MFLPTAGWFPPRRRKRTNKKSLQFCDNYHYPYASNWSTFNKETFLGDSQKELLMVDVRVLKTGCAGCRKIEKLLEETLHEMGIRDASVEFISGKPTSDRDSSADASPYLVIDGEQLWICSPPTKEELMEWLYRATAITVI